MPALLQINTVINSGSTGRITEEIGQLAIKNGWESYIAYGRNDRPSSSIKIKIGTKRSIYLHALKTRLSDRHGFGSKQATKQFIRQIESIQPDIIHLHNLHGYYINIGILFDYLAKSNIPVVWTLHDCWAFTGHCAHFDYIGCEKWKSLCYFCPQTGKYPAGLLIDSSRKNYMDKKKLFACVPNMTIVPVSQWLNNLIDDSFLSNYQTMMIYNGVNTNLFFPQEKFLMRKKLHIDESAFVIIGVASIWEERKGLMDFIELSRRVDADTKIILVGVTENQKKNLPQNIKGITRTENVEDLALLYSCSDVFLNLTYEDNFPTTNLEALACGTPVITYKTGGSVESINNEVGYVVSQGNLHEIMKAIDRIREKGKAYYLEACRNRSVHLYNKDERYAVYMELYQEKLIKRS